MTNAQTNEKTNATQTKLFSRPCLHVLCDVGSNMTKLQPWHLIFFPFFFFPFWYLVLFFPSPARWGPLDFIRVASSSSGNCEFRDLSGHCRTSIASSGSQCVSGHCRTSTASSEVSGHCRPPDPAGTAGPQLRADLSGHCRKINCGCQISVCTAGPQLRAPDLCRPATASSKSQWALPDLNCERQISAGTRSGSARARENARIDAR